VSIKRIKREKVQLAIEKEEFDNLEGLDE